LNKREKKRTYDVHGLGVAVYKNSVFHRCGVY
jgi:hypothetical protein